ncbi:replication protein A 70 kDa DNA-binding subunit B-like [Chenopodium quinoa]|uniref:replication protein A 70 kDa DNA-binding subunit B-like n=1 Tax=Chenopodium quinoa TaxID=63459 RepID=UPI000B77E23F|nr:replication protein A 70 kDa DNA-binding subunit B-like [Chenopodium quinoa]
MKPEYTPIGNLTPQNKAYKVRARVIEKAEPKLSPNKTLYQLLKLEDSEGNRIRGTLFENEVHSFKGILELGREYEIANAPLRVVDEKWKTREDDCQMTFGGNTSIQPLQSEAGPVLPKYTPIASIPRTSSKSERFDAIGVILYMEQVRQIKTASGASMDVREVMITDDSIYQPLILSLWGGLAIDGCEKLAAWASIPLIAGFTYMRPTAHNGFSLSSSMSTLIILGSSGDTAEHLKKWSRDKKPYINELMAKVLLIREPPVERIITTIGELKLKKLTDTMQEERIWLKAKIPEPDVRKIIAYIGCDNCGCRCEELAGETFKCSSCPNKVCTTTARVNYTFTITDGTGELKLAAFGAECEKLFGMKLADIYSKEHWDGFDEAAARLSTTEAYFCV